MDRLIEQSREKKSNVFVYFPKGGDEETGLLVCLRSDTRASVASRSSSVDADLDDNGANAQQDERARNSGKGHGDLVLLLGGHDGFGLLIAQRSGQDCLEVSR
jgi:hypothetical protein